MSAPGAANPYAPPTGDIELARPPAEGAFAGALFSPRQMLAAAWFGSLLVGMLMLWWNYRAMAKAWQARLALVAALTVGVTWLLLGFVLPARIQGALPNIIAALQFYGFCNPIQGPAVYRHFAAGGQRASNWIVFGIVLMSAVLMAVIGAAASPRF